MKRVLLCAFYFMPRNNIASYRSGCFAKYLPENGWLPTVLCQDWPEGSPNYDPDFVGVFPKEVQVIRVPNPPLRGFRERVLLRKIAPYLWPQRAPLVWWQRARAAMLALTREQRFDAVWGTSDPLVPLALAQEAARTQRVRWIADIRDSYNVQHFGSWYKRPLFARAESRLCRQADRVTTVSEGLAEVVSQRSGRSVQVINNGFDPGLFEGPAPAPATDVFRVVYAGTVVWPQQNPLPFFQAIDLCLREGRIPRGQFEVCFYASDLGNFSRDNPGVVEGLPVRVLPRISHHEIIGVLKSSPVLLLLAHANEKGVLTGKVFDYLAASRPILAVPDDRGEVTALLKRTGAGVALTQVAQIADQLTAWFTAWKAGRELSGLRNQVEINRYSRREQTRQVAGILNELAS